MLRPRKWKKACCLPEINLYSPLNGLGRENEIINEQN